MHYNTQYVFINLNRNFTTRIDTGREGEKSECIYITVSKICRFQFKCKSIVNYNSCVCVGGVRHVLITMASFVGSLDHRHLRSVPDVDNNAALALPSQVFRLHPLLDFWGIRSPVPLVCEVLPNKAHLIV